jgi:hypothetical protein
LSSLGWYAATTDTDTPATGFPSGVTSLPRIGSSAVSRSVGGTAGGMAKVLTQPSPNPGAAATSAARRVSSSSVNSNVPSSPAAGCGAGTIPL